MLNPDTMKQIIRPPNIETKPNPTTNPTGTMSSNKGQTNAPNIEPPSPFFDPPELLISRRAASPRNIPTNPETTCNKGIPTRNTKEGTRNSRLSKVRTAEPVALFAPFRSTESSSPPDDESPPPGVFTICSTFVRISPAD
jgi:hypothetical protein